MKQAQKNLKRLLWSWGGMFVIDLVLLYWISMQWPHVLSLPWAVVAALFLCNTLHTLVIWRAGELPCSDERYQNDVNAFSMFEKLFMSCMPIGSILTLGLFVFHQWDAATASAILTVVMIVLHIVALSQMDHVRYTKKSESIS
jgi:hypothetical protein